MIPIIDVSKVLDDESFIRLNKSFGLAQRLARYNEYALAGNTHEAVEILKILQGVLDGHESKREVIVKEGLEKEAGAALAAIEYALMTIAGSQPDIPFNNSSTKERIVLDLP